MTLVVDASFLLACVLEDERSNVAVAAAAERLHSGEPLVAPFHLPVELLSGLEQAARRGRLAGVDRVVAYRAAIYVGLELVTLPVEGGPGFPALFDLVDRTGLRTYDALYLQLALSRGAALATLDAALRGASRSEGILVIPDLPRRLEPGPPPARERGKPVKKSR